jgi:trimeric autotransporter adhesin
MNIQFRILAILLASAQLNAVAHAAELPVIPQQIQFSGALPSSGTAGISFSLYGEQSGGTALWLETQNVLVSDTGSYSVLLGSETLGGIPQSIFASGEARWLEVSYIDSLGAPVTQPRVLLVSVPYAMKAGDAETLGGLPASAFLLNPKSLAARVGDAGGLPGAAVTDVLPSAAVTSGRIAKFTDGAGATGDSIMTENAGRIGVNNPSPSETLDVDGSLLLRNTGQLKFHATGDAAARYQMGVSGIGGMQFQSLDGVTPRAFFLVSSQGAANFQVQMENGDLLSLGKADLVGGAVLGSYVGQSLPPVGGLIVSGNVGVGTNAPTQKLHVAGNLLTSGTVTSAGEVTSAFTLTGNGAGAGKVLTSDATGVATWQTAAGGGATLGANIFTGDQAINGLLTVNSSHTTNLVGTIQGNANAATGQTFGVAGVTSSATSNAAGVVGTAASASGMVYGVSGSTSSATDFSVGVIGNANAASGQTRGVVGTTVSTTNNAAGVVGNANGAAGQTRGVQGNTVSSTNGAIGVLGRADNSAGGVGIGLGAVRGVLGSTNSITNNATGVLGTATGVTGQTTGVRGTNASTTDFAVAVEGDSSAATGRTYGVVGTIISTATEAAGTRGFALASTGETYGVEGINQSTTEGASGVHGIAYAATGETNGVLGRNNSNTDFSAGVFGETNATTGWTFGAGGASESTHDFAAGTLGAYFGAGGGSGVLGFAGTATGAGGTFINFTGTGKVISGRSGSGAPLLNGLPGPPYPEVFQVQGDGDVVANTGDFQALAAGKGLILKSPDGLTCARLSIANTTGTLVSTLVACPLP